MGGQASAGQADGEPSAPSPGTGDATGAGTQPTTDGTLLGGRVSYRQFRDGYRTGIEPVLLAAAVPARVGDRVLEAGCGAGAGLLCLSARIPGLASTGIEQDPGTAGLARHNLDRNGLEDWSVLATSLHESLAHVAGGFDHAMANPPWHLATGSASPGARRDLAKRAPPGMLADWVGWLAGRLRDGGTLTLILPATQHAAAAAAMSGCRLGSIRLLPLWPLAGRAARIILLQGVRGGRGDGLVLPGLALHHQSGRYTDEAEAVLRHGTALRMESAGGGTSAPR